MSPLRITAHLEHIFDYFLYTLHFNNRGVRGVVDY